MSWAHVICNVSLTCDMRKWPQTESHHKLILITYLLCCLNCFQRNYIAFLSKCCIFVSIADVTPVNLLWSFICNHLIFKKIEGFEKIKIIISLILSFLSDIYYYRKEGLIYINWNDWSFHEFYVMSLLLRSCLDIN